MLDAADGGARLHREGITRLDLGMADGDMVVEIVVIEGIQAERGGRLCRQPYASENKHTQQEYSRNEVMPPGCHLLQRSVPQEPAQPDPAEDYPQHWHQKHTTRYFR